MLDGTYRLVDNGVNNGRSVLSQVGLQVCCKFVGRWYGGVRHRCSAHNGYTFVAVLDKAASRKNSALNSMYGSGTVPLHATSVTRRVSPTARKRCRSKSSIHGSSLDVLEALGSDRLQLDDACFGCMWYVGRQRLYQKCCIDWRVIAGSDFIAAIVLGLRDGSAGQALPQAPIAPRRNSRFL
jgi:hypothetical protein